MRRDPEIRVFRDKFFAISPKSRQAARPTEFYRRTPNASMLLKRVAVGAPAIRFALLIASSAT